MRPHQSAISAKSANWVAGWQDNVARLLSAVGTDRFADELDRNMAELVPFDLSVIVAYPAESHPVLLHDGIRNQGSAEALEAYFRGAYVLDPFYSACMIPVPDGLYRMRELAPDSFFEGEYSNSWEVHPCISMESGSLAEEIGYLCGLPDRSMLAYSLMRSNGSPPFGEDEFEALRLVEPIVRTLATKHFGSFKQSEPLAGQRPVWSSRGQVMELAFESFGSADLSSREQMVVKLVLQGHSAESIARSLGIAEGTVRNHRKNIYAKLRISSQQELFSLFLTHILA